MMGWNDDRQVVVNAECSQREDTARYRQTYDNIINHNITKTNTCLTRYSVIQGFFSLQFYTKVQF